MVMLLPVVMAATKYPQIGDAVNFCSDWVVVQFEIISDAKVAHSMSIRFGNYHI